MFANMHETKATTYIAYAFDLAQSKSSTGVIIPYLSANYFVIMKNKYIYILIESLLEFFGVSVSVEMI